MNTKAVRQRRELFDRRVFAGPLDLSAAELEGETLRFDSEHDRDRAIAIGAFRLVMPDGFDPEPGRQIAQKFHLPEAANEPGYGGYREEENLCFWRSAYQMEQLIISRECRERLFPAELLAMTRALDQVSANVLRAILALCDVPQAKWDALTGGAASDTGTHWFVANSYRPQVGTLSGCTAHQDTGFVTVLYIEDEGLEGFVDGAWRSINPRDGYFVVNFGLALKILTRRHRFKPAALKHRVRLEPRSSSARHRISFAALASPPTHGTLYEHSYVGEARPQHDVDEFLRKQHLATWREDA